jgi:hypothetical protein
MIVVFFSWLNMGLPETLFALAFSVDEVAVDQERK